MMRILEQCFRIYTDARQFETMIAFYEQLQGVTCSRRVRIAENGIEVAKIGGFLLLGGDKAKLDPVRHVDAIFYADSLDDFASWLTANGAEVLHPSRTVTGGSNLTARHPDGLVVEYFQASAAR